MSRESHDADVPSSAEKKSGLESADSNILIILILAKYQILTRTRSEWIHE